MQRYYYENRYDKSHISRVRKVYETENEKAVIFEETIFFPGGGGQAADRGFFHVISDDDKNPQTIYIKDVREENGEILHILDDKSVLPAQGSKVEMFIDWKRREDNMHQHTAQHILSGCFYSRFKRNTKGLHIGQDISQLDIEGSFDDDMVYEIEDFANRVVNDAIEIKNYEIAPEDMISTYTRRPLPVTDEPVRILEIPDLDINACCGVHAYCTRDIRLIKIVKYYRHKDGTRFEYLAGNRAVDFVLGRERVFSKILDHFNTNEDSIENAIANLEYKKDEMYSLYRNASVQLMDYQLTAMSEKAMTNDDGLKLYSQNFIVEDMKYITSLAKKITEEDMNMVFFTKEENNGIKILMQTSPKTAKTLEYLDLGKIFREIAQKTGAKGGGSPYMAQGVIENKKDVDIFLKNIYSIISV